MRKFSAIEFDRFLAEDCAQPTWMMVHPKYYNGYWEIKATLPYSWIFRWVGRKLHSRRIYWLGFQIMWVHGLKEYLGSEWGEPQVVNLDD
jgi:hypothetical protein